MPAILIAHNWLNPKAYLINFVHCFCYVKNLCLVFEQCMCGEGCCLKKTQSLNCVIIIFIDYCMEQHRVLSSSLIQGFRDVIFKKDTLFCFHQVDSMSEGHLFWV